MTLIKPFPGWRPKPELVEEVSAPPYDVLNRQEAAALARGNPNSFLHVSKAEIDLPDSVSPYDPQVYMAAKARFKEMQTQGILQKDPSPYLYFYRLIMDGREQLGLVAAASVAAYDSDRIKKHEFTRPAKEDDRTRISEALSAHSGPVFLTYRNTAVINALAARCVTETAPVYDFLASDGIQHTLWVVADAAIIADLVTAFEALPSLYVADGHHRSAAASRVAAAKRKENSLPADQEGSADRFLSVIFPDNQMHILDYNRVVQDLNGRSVETFLAEVAKIFTVIPSPTPFKPSQPNSFGMYLATGQWYELHLAKDKINNYDPVARLDVSLLNQYLLEPILGIRDPRRDPRIDFVGGIRGLDGLMDRVNSKEMAIAFSMYPTALSDLMAVADASTVMPPKSTWFEPKLRDGLVIQEI